MERLSSIVSWFVQFHHHCTCLKKLPQNNPSHIIMGPQDQKLQSKNWIVVASKSNWWQPPNSILTKGRLYPGPIEVIWTEKSLNNFLRANRISYVRGVPRWLRLRAISGHGQKWFAANGVCWQFTQGKFSTLHLHQGRKNSSSSYTDSWMCELDVPVTHFWLLFNWNWNH